jgi:hypothetical protein
MEYLKMTIIEGASPTHEHLGTAMDWDRLLNIGWEERMGEARWLKPKLSEASV